MQNSSHSETLAQFIHSDSISNGGLVVDQATFRVSGTSNATPGMETALSSHSAAELDDDSDSDSEANLVGNHEFLLQQQQQQPPQLQQQQQQQQQTTGPKPGKKTKGRVKIKMEFIENKLRRYTTFSKRKTGIMKKAYELSTLTGTQVMLLVASETGHVYTFATRKLQPMITSESGKALIQTCLNSPDPPPVGPGQQQAVEQRMNPTGFEETELTYAVSEEESKAELKPLLQVASMTAASPEQIMSSQSAGVTTTAYHPLVTSQHPTTTYIPALTTATSTASSAKASNISMQLPPGGITAILQPAGTPITIPFQQSGQNLTQSNTATQQTVYRIPAPSQVVSLGNVSQTGNNTGETVNVSGTTATTTASSVGLMTAPTTVTNGATMTPGIVMYQTPQGVVYATPTTATLPDGSIFNFQQPATAISVPQADQQTGAQQIITIPVPVTLAGSQMLQFAASSEPPPSLTEVAQPPQTKKARK